jgi:hypothetical protein
MAGQVVLMVQEAFDGPLKESKHSKRTHKWGVI